MGYTAPLNFADKENALQSNNRFKYSIFDSVGHFAIKHCFWNAMYRYIHLFVYFVFKRNAFIYWFQMNLKHQTKPSQSETL